MWKIVFPGKLYDKLVKELFSTSPNENGCFLLSNTFVTKKGQKVMKITEIIEPDENSWNRQTENSLEPRAVYINRAVTLAEEKDASLLLVHTHPHVLHPTGFSYIDEQSNHRLFENLSSIIDVPLGSLVFSSRGICGVIYENGKTKPISDISISGHVFSKITAADFVTEKMNSDQSIDRQSKALGQDRNRMLQGMKIAVIGVGGTGSAVVAQLARMRVKHLLLVDRDVMELSNLSRVYGSTELDCKKSRSKVEAIAQSLKSFSNTMIETLHVDITKTDVELELTDCDIIFSCTDNLSSREKLNGISLKHYIPLIDIGCKIELDVYQTIKQSIVKVQVVTPDDACLWCSGALDGKTILQESLPKKERENLAKEGYYQETEKQPSIITTTTKAATIGVEKLLSLIGTFGPDYHSRIYVETRSGLIHEDSPSIQHNCICQTKRDSLEKKRIPC